MAEALEIDAVIDPARTREWILKGLTSACRAERPSGTQAHFVNSW